MNHSSDNHSSDYGPLGNTTTYVDQYTADLLHPIARAESRQTLALPAPYPWQGVDIWNAYEVSWLNAHGLPQVARAEFIIPADSTCLIESKSFKLFLNSLNQTVFENKQQVCERLTQDLSHAAQAPVIVHLYDLDETWPIVSPPGICLEQQYPDTTIQSYQTTPELLKAAEGTARVTDVVFSRLLKSNCPVTSQPDWGTLALAYTGQAICHRSLLQYIVSYRQHNGFHEHCVESIFSDLYQRFDLEKLTVYARYVRRGGLDINPYRSSETLPSDLTILNQRLNRQ